MNIAERIEQLEAQIEAQHNIPMISDITDHVQMLGSQATWIGAAIGCLLIGAAIYLRRWRDES